MSAPLTTEPIHGGHLRAFLTGDEHQAGAAVFRPWGATVQQQNAATAPHDIDHV